MNGLTMNICIITGSRADWGLLAKVARVVANDDSLILTVVATGQHFCKDYGSTYTHIDYPHIKILSSPRNDTRRGISDAMGDGFKKFGKLFNSYRPDCVVVLGDRWEIFVPVVTAYMYGIPVAHIHGGETTYNAYDDGFRHAITKFSTLHFPAHKKYAQRIKCMGESPLSVFSCGCIGVDGLKPVRGKGSHYVVIVHPTTLDAEDYSPLFERLCEIDAKKYVIHPNLDATTLSFRNALMKFAAKDKTVVYVRSLRRDDFIDLLATAQAIVGNSSSGVIEAPTLRTPTINIGDRQKGREMASSIIHAGADRLAIERAFRVLESKKFKNVMKYSKPAYKGNNVAEKIVDTITKELPDVSVKKEFYNVLSR